MKYVVSEVRKSTNSALVEAETEEKALEVYTQHYTFLETLHHEETKLSVVPAVEPHPVQMTSDAEVAQTPASVN